MLAQLPTTGELFAGRYRILERIGEGGYGVVYRARQDAMGRDVAIKMLKPEASEDEVEVERFRREVFHAAGLRSPHTINLYDFGETSGLFYIVMEFLEGINLRDRVAHDGPLAHDGALDVVMQILKSLREAHEHGIVHRDLKPENIFLCEVGPSDDVVKVLDFGLSKYVASAPQKEPTLTKDGVIFGTPQYMSPEQAYGLEIFPATDIYAVGLLTYEMLTADHAFTGSNSMEILIKQVSDPVPGLPDDLGPSLLSEFIDVCTAKEIEDRFQDAAQALKWLTDRQNENSIVTMVHSVEPPDIDQYVDGAVEDPEDEAPEPGTPDELPMRLAQLPLFGRSEELDALLDWSDTALHSGGIAWVTGDLGIGKTRLVDEWLGHLELDGAIILSGRHREDGGSLEGIREALRPLYADDSEPDQTLPTVLTPARMQELRKLLAPGSTAEHFTPDDAGRDFSFVLIEKTMYALASARPTVLLLEDVHRADSFTLRLLLHWQEELATRTVPLLLVFTSRSDELGAPDALNELSRLARRYSSVSFVRDVDLGPLDDAPAHDLLRYLLPLTDDTADYVSRQAGGNPLYLTQILQYLSEEELLEEDDETGKFHFVPAVAEESSLVPPNLRTLLLRRIKRLVNEHPLGAVLRAILTRAMLIGTRFEHRLLKATLREEGRQDLEAYLDDALDVLARANVLVPTVLGERPGLEFRYDLQRRALFESQIAAGEDLGALHRLIAEIKIARCESEDGQDPEEAAEIADHFRAAGDRRESFDWQLVAARAAESAQDFRSALSRYRDAEALLDESFDTEGERLLDIRLAQGRLYRFLGEFGPAEYALRNAHEEARRVGDLVGEAMAGESLAEVLKLLGEYDEAAALYEDVGELYAKFSDPVGELRCEIGLGEIARFLGAYHDARQIFEEALERAPDSGDDDDVAIRCLLGLGQSAYAAGRIDAATNLLRRARKRAEAVGDSRLTSQADIELALISVHTQGVDTAEQLARSALEVKQSLGDALGEAFAHLILGMCLRRSTLADQAELHARRSRAINERLGHTYGIAKSILLEAEITWVRGRVDEAVAGAVEAEELHDEINDAHGMAISKIFRGLFETDRGNTELARSLHEEALELGGREGLGLYQPQCLVGIGLAYEAEGVIEEAVAYFGEALQLAEAIGNREYASIAASCLAKTHLTMGDIESARQDVPLARRQAELLGNNIAMVFAVTTEALLARLTGDATRLHASLQTLRRLSDPRHGIDLRIPQRLVLQGRLMLDNQPLEKAKATARAVLELLEAIGADDAAQEFLSDLPSG